MSARFLRDTVVFDASSGALDKDILAPVNGLVPTGIIGPNSQIELVIANSGDADAYIGTPVDVAGEAPNTAATNLVIAAGATGVNVGPFDASAGLNRLRLRLFEGAVLRITPLFTRR
jgi:hypothetical protein